MAEHNQQFDTFLEWVNKAPSWLTRRGSEIRAICYDTKGRVCRIGGDFMRARDEDAFPVRWVWPDQVAAQAATVDKYEAEIERLEEECANLQVAAETAKEREALITTLRGDVEVGRRMEQTLRKIAYGREVRLDDGSSVRVAIDNPAQLAADAISATIAEFVEG